MSTTDRHHQMRESLRDPEFRRQFIDEHVNVGIAFQIRSLRNRQGLNQVELAQRLGVKQPQLSSWEDPNYGKYTLTTLKELAKVFDVGLLVRFVPFSTLVDWTIDLDPDNIAPSSFEEEEKSRIKESTTVDQNALEGTKDTNPYDQLGLLLSGVPKVASTARTEKELANA